MQMQLNLVNSQSLHQLGEYEEKEGIKGQNDQTQRKTAELGGLMQRPPLGSPESRQMKGSLKNDQASNVDDAAMQSFKTMGSLPIVEQAPLPQRLSPSFDFVPQGFGFRGTSSEEINTMIEYADAFCEARKNGQIDIKNTHLSYLSEVIVHNFETLFSEEKTSTFDPERLATVNEYRKEMDQRIREKNVTYQWWLEFNLQFSTLATPNPSPYTSQQSGDEDGVGNRDEDIFLYPTCLANLEIVDMNKTCGTSLHPIGLSNKMIMGDGAMVNPQNFFFHDLQHIMNFISYLKEEKESISDEDLRMIKALQKKHELIQEWLSEGNSVPRELKQLIDFIYFYHWHEELGGVKQLCAFVTNPHDAKPLNLKYDYRFHRSDWYLDSLPKPASLGFKSTFEMLTYGQEALQILLASTNSNEANSRLLILERKRFLNEKWDQIKGYFHTKLQTQMDKSEDVLNLVYNFYEFDIEVTEKELDLYNDIVRAFNSGDNDQFNSLLAKANSYPNLRQVLDRQIFGIREDDEHGLIV